MVSPKQPQDHKTAMAEKRGKTISIEHGGVTYEVPADALDDVELVEYIEDEKYITAIRNLIGPDQWARFKDSARNEHGKVPVETFQLFIEKVFDQLGN